MIVVQINPPKCMHALTFASPKPFQLMNPNPNCMFHKP
jgi:hypothetical protein